MYQSSYVVPIPAAHGYYAVQQAANTNQRSCNWDALFEQLLQQWKKLTPLDLQAAGHDCKRIAKVIERKYGVDSRLAENYLRNFEHTMPMVGT